jgi:tetratricopeptide (TPR) repeat protein
LLSFAGYASLWVTAVYFLKRRPMLSFLLFWPLVVLLPISFGVTVLDLKLGDVIFEHRLYLASAGAIVAFAVGLVRLKERLRSLRPAYGTAVTAAAVALSVAFCGAAYARNSLWADGINLWSDVIEKAPYKARGYNNRGEFYMMMKDFASAIEDFEVSVELEPHWRNHHNAAVAYGKLKSDGSEEKAFRHYLAALRIKPDLFEAHNNIGIIYYKKKMYEEATRHFAETVRLRPKYGGGYFLLGAVHLAQGRPDYAERAFKEAIKADPRHKGAHKALGDLYMKRGDTARARRHYEKARQ